MGFCSKSKQGTCLWSIVVARFIEHSPVPYFRFNFSSCYSSPFASSAEVKFLTSLFFKMTKEIEKTVQTMFNPHDKKLPEKRTIDILINLLVLQEVAQKFVEFFSVSQLRNQLFFLSLQSLRPEI